MKKIIIIAASILLLSAFACRKPANVIESPTANPKAAPTEFLEHGAPPERPIFHSIEEYLLLASAVDLDDAECETFLQDNFLFSGIETKADVIKTLEIINSMPFPTADGLKLVTVELTDFINQFGVFYGIEGDDENRFLSFRMSLTSSNGEADRKELEQQYPLVELPETHSSELKYLARVGTAASGDPDYPFSILTYLTNIRSHEIQIKTSLSEEEFLDILANCEIITMDEYAKKANP